VLFSILESTFNFADRYDRTEIFDSDLLAAVPSVVRPDSLLLLLTSTVIAFILLVVATCSTPVNENIYLFELRGTSSNETTIARIGVLGLCGDYIGRYAHGTIC
jgi:hypothetical protein